MPTLPLSVPLSTWREISQEEAQATFQQGIPVLLYGEHGLEFFGPRMDEIGYQINVSTCRWS